MLKKRLKFNEVISNMKDNEYTAYVCQTDWDYHFPDDWHGVNIYFSEKSIKEHRKCVEECGIVKIKVSFEEVVQEAIPFGDRK